MKYINKFADASEYNAYLEAGNIPLPNLSMIHTERKINMKQKKGTGKNTYLTFEAIESGTFKFIAKNNNVLSYSIDNGETWVELASNTNTPTISTGSKIMWKGNCTVKTEDQWNGSIG